MGKRSDTDMIIPFEELNSETLLALVESFILREGTDYGDDEVSLTTKSSQIVSQIEQQKIFIVYSELHESFDLIPANRYQP